MRFFLPLVTLGLCAVPAFSSSEETSAHKIAAYGSSRHVSATEKLTAATGRPLINVLIAATLLVGTVLGPLYAVRDVFPKFIQVRPPTLACAASLGSARMLRGKASNPYLIPGSFSERVMIAFT